MNLFKIIVSLFFCFLLLAAGNQQPPAPYPVPGKDKNAWFELLNTGYNLLLAGNIVNSTNAYRSALIWTERYADMATKEEVLEYVLKPLGNNYTRLGDYEQALSIQKKALQIAIILNDPNQLVGTYSNLAATTSSMGMAEQSLMYCKEGLKFSSANALYGLLLSEQAEALHILRQTDSARKAILKSLYVLEKNSATGSNVAYWLLMAYQQAGDIHLSQPLIAKQFYNKALTLQTKLLQQNGDIRKRERAKLFYRLGSLYQQLNQYKESDYWLKECLAVLVPGKTFAALTEKELYGENTLMDVLFAKGNTLFTQKKTNEALNLYRLCFVTEKKLRNEYITGASKERSVADSRLRYETAINAAYTAWEQTRQPIYRNQVLQFIESGKAQLLLEELLQQQRYSKTLSNDSLINRIINTSYINSSFLQEKQLARSYFTGKQFIYTVESGKNGITFIDKQLTSASGQDSIHQFIEHYFQHGAAAMMDYPKAYYREAYHIYQQLFTQYPLQAEKEYILLPDGILNTLPFDALITQPTYINSIAQWPFVIKQTVISYAYSLQTLKEQFLNPSTSKGFAGFFIAENNQQQPMLGAVLKEKKGISKTVQQGQWLLNKQATVAAFRKALKTEAVVHISTHAFATKDSSLTPHIQLYDSSFYLFELKGMQQHASLVILSACRTGDGRLVTGEGVQSLARAFTANGTNAVVAGWWNVNDEMTAQLMEKFYQSVAMQSNTAHALREAKLKWLNDTKIPYAQKLPYYWAALNYQGHPHALADNSWMNGDNPSSIYIIVLSIGIILLCCILLFYLRRQKWSSTPG